MTPLGGQLLVDAAACGVLDRGGAAHHAAGAVAGGAERLLHAARLADQHPTRPAHVAGNDDRLADLAISGRHLGMAGRKGPRRPLAVHPHPLALAVRPRALRTWRCCGPRRRPGSSAALATSGRRSSAKHSRACHISSCRLHQAKLAAAPHRADVVAGPRGCRPAHRPAAGRAVRCRTSPAPCAASRRASSHTW